jgi:hypothetical protein
MTRTLLEKAQTWMPCETDTLGPTKKKLINYLCEHCRGKKNAKGITSVIADLGLKEKHTKESFQLNIIGPLREVPDLFIGTSTKGIFLVESTQDAFDTIHFYTHRIRSERKHLKNLKLLAKKNHLFEKEIIEPKKDTPTIIYFDESGSPDLNNIYEKPYFIVSAIILDGKRPEVMVRKKIDSLKVILSKPQEYEFKSGDFNTKEYELIMKELTTIGFEYCAACFIKPELKTEGFTHPKSFYKYTTQYLVGTVLDYVGDAKLQFDEYGGKDSSFKDEFFEYLRNQNSGFPRQKIEQLNMLDSKTEPLIQLADLMAGAIKMELKGYAKLLNIIEEKIIEIRCFPVNRSLDLSISVL